MLTRNAARNGLSNVQARTTNVFDELRALERVGERFDTIVLDPPAFAKTQGCDSEGHGRLQGNQPARAETADARRLSDHLQLLVSRQRGGVRRSDPRRRARRPRRRERRREADAGPRSSRRAGDAGDVLPEVLHPEEARIKKHGGPSFRKNLRVCRVATASANLEAELHAKLELAHRLARGGDLPVLRGSSPTCWDRARRAG